MWAHCWYGYLNFATFLYASDWNVTLELRFRPCYFEGRIIIIGLVASVRGWCLGRGVASLWKHGGTHSRILVHAGLVELVLLLDWILINGSLLVNLKFLMHVRLLVAVVDFAVDSLICSEDGFLFGLGSAVNVARKKLISAATKVVTLMKRRGLLSKDSCIVLVNSRASVEYLFLERLLYLIRRVVHCLLSHTTWNGRSINSMNVRLIRSMMDVTISMVNMALNR